MKYRKYIIPAIAVLIIALIVYQDEGAASTSEADRVVALSRIWSYAKDYYGCWELTDESLDWDQEYERAIDKMKKVSSEYEVMSIVRESHGVIMDLRSNSGGMTAVGKSILKCFYSTELPEFQMKSAIKINKDIAMSYIFGESMRAALPSYSDVYKEEKNTIDEIAARGRRMYEGKYVITMAQYDKIMEILGVSESPETDEAADIEFCGVPCVILINHKSGAAIDSTAAIAKSAGVPMIGTRTKGATGNMAKFDLGSGYTLTISTDYDFTPEGKAINNCGIEADIYVEQSLEDERRLIDSQLEYAKSYLLNP